MPRAKTKRPEVARRDRESPPLSVAQVGTFDFENFGDLFFPLLLRAGLGDRLDGAPTLYSYASRKQGAWPFEVRPLELLFEQITDFDLVVVGGGDLIRFDKSVGPGYEPGDERLHHPTALWMAPTLIGAAHGVPVAWNGVGVPGEVPAWGARATAAALASAGYVGVRDQLSAERLRKVNPDAEIRVVPDSAFAARRLVPRRMSPEVRATLGELGIEGPYVVLQPSPRLRPFAKRIEAGLQQLIDRGTTVLELPISPGHGDAVGQTGAEVDSVSPAGWPHPLMLAELISRASGAIGVSMHLTVLCAVFGVPVTRPASLLGDESKQRSLAGLPGVSHFDPDAADPVRPPRASTAGAGFRRGQAGALREHWRRLAAAASRAPDPAPLADLAARLPGALEAADSDIGGLREALTVADRDRAELGERIAELEDSGEAQRSQLARLEDGLRSVRAQLASSEAERTELRSERDELELKRDALEESGASSEERLAATRTSLEEVSEERRRLEERERAASREAERLRSSIAALEEDRTALRTSRDALERSLAAGSEGQERLRAELERVQASARAAHEEGERLRAAVSELREGLRVADRDRLDLRADRDAHQREGVELRKRAEELERRLAEISEEAERQREHAGALEQAQADALESFRERESGLAQLLEAARADRDAAGERAADAGAETAAAVARIGELEAAVGAAAAERSRTEQLLDAARADRDRMTEEVRRLQAEAERLARSARQTEYWVRHLEASASWRITAPLRALSGRLRRRRMDRDAVIERSEAGG